MAIKNIVHYLHSASLMLDDIEDHSLLRRGKPCTHRIFGEAQTINSANYLFVLATNEVGKLKNPQAREVYIQQLQRLHIGQSMDLHWTNAVICPQEKGYLDMVDHKTGGLFCMVAELMRAEGRLGSALGLTRFMSLLGRYFQIRDDYMNLESANYTQLKGFCEDFDEGKFSLILVHALKHSANKSLIFELLQARKRDGSMSHEAKVVFLEEIRRSRSLQYVRDVLVAMEQAIDDELTKIEDATMDKNYVLRLMIERLRL